MNSSINVKFDIQNSNFNELKYELNETLSHSLKSMNNRIEEVAVSYTHLDVYKRQQ